MSLNPARILWLQTVYTVLDGDSSSDLGARTWPKQDGFTLVAARLCSCPECVLGCVLECVTRLCVLLCCTQPVHVARPHQLVCSNRLDSCRCTCMVSSPHCTRVSSASHLFKWLTDPFTADGARLHLQSRASRPAPSQHCLHVFQPQPRQQSTHYSVL